MQQCSSSSGTGHTGTEYGIQSTWYDSPPLPQPSDDSVSMSELHWETRGPVLGPGEGGVRLDEEEEKKSAQASKHETPVVECYATYSGPDYGALVVVVYRLSPGKEWVGVRRGSCTEKNWSCFPSFPLVLTNVTRTPSIMWAIRGKTRKKGLKRMNSPVSRFSRPEKGSGGSPVTAGRLPVSTVATYSQ